MFQKSVLFIIIMFILIFLLNIISLNLIVSSGLFCHLPRQNILCLNFINNMICHKIAYKCYYVQFLLFIMTSSNQHQCFCFYLYQSPLSSLLFSSFYVPSFYTILFLQITSQYPGRTPLVVYSWWGYKIVFTWPGLGGHTNFLILTNYEACRLLASNHFTLFFQGCCFWWYTGIHRCHSWTWGYHISENFGLNLLVIGPNWIFLPCFYTGI